MSQEVSGDFTLSCVQGTDTIRLGGSIAADIGTGRVICQDYTVGADELLDVEDITAVDFFAIRNLDVDPAKYVDIGSTTGVYQHRLYGSATSGKGGWVAGSWNGGATIYANSSAGSQIIRVFLINVINA